MTSNDTLGTGMSGNVSTFLPSVTLNGTAPSDGSYIPRPWKSKVTSVEAGIGTPTSPALTMTYTPQQIADFLSKYIIGSAMGPQDELSPFERSLQSDLAIVGQRSEAPVHFTGSRPQGPFGDGMAGWSSSINAPNSQQPGWSEPQQQGGLLGLLRNYMRNDDSASY